MQHHLMPIYTTLSKLSELVELPLSFSVISSLHRGDIPLESTAVVVVSRNHLITKH
jgi:hypothetical protein